MQSTTPSGARILALMLAGGAVGLGCSLLVDTGGLVGSPSVDVPVDAAVDVTVLDAGTDAVSPTDGDAAPSPATGCALFKDASFCEDFDGVDPFSISKWTIADVDASVGSLAVTATTSVSAPRSAAFAMHASPPACSYLRLMRRFAGPYARFRAEISLRVEATGYVLNLHAGSSPLGASYQVNLSFDANAIAVAHLQKDTGGGGFDISSTSIGLEASAIGRWLLVTAEIVEATGTIIVGVDGAEGSISTPSDFLLTDPTVQLGPYCTGNALALEADDVRVYLTPQ